MNAKTARNATYFRRMLAAIFEFMLRTGLSKDSSNKIVRNALETAGSRATAETSFGHSSDLVIACMVLDRWRRTRRYLDQSAQPRALKLLGPAPSVEALVKAELRLRQGTLEVSQMRSFGLITHVGGGRYKPSSPSGVVTGLSPAFQYQVAHTLFMLLRTIRTNMSLPRKSDRLIERFAEIPDLPIEHAGDFREFAKQQGTHFLHTVNDWLESRCGTKTRSSKRRTVAGIHVYAYMGDAPSSLAHGARGSKRYRTRSR